MPPADVRLVYWIASGAFGLLVGSFLNVVIFRLPRECMSIVRPRSRCVTCLRAILWYENVPVFSYIALRGRCRGCGTKIGWRYPLVELITGAVFFYLAWRFLYVGWQPGHFFVLTVTFAAMIASTFIDFDFKILPDQITIPGIAFGIAVGVAYPEWHEGMLPEAIANPRLAGLVASTVGATFGFGLLLMVRVVGQLIFRKEAMGWGDVKYIAGLGGLLGWQGVLATFVLACFAGSIVGIGILLARKSHYVPFGPYLSLGAAAMLLFRPEIMGLIDAYVRWVRGEMM